MSSQAPREGFSPHFRASKVTDPWEPLYSRKTSSTVDIGLWLRDVHCNSRGLVHGGVIATLADNAMGLSYLQQAMAQGVALEAASRGAVTVTLSVDYVAAGKLGQWLQVTPRVVRAGRTLGFVDALITADDVVIARANATFSVASG